MSLVQPKVGKEYKVKANRSSHGYLIGAMVRVESSAGNSLYRCVGVSGDDNGVRYSCYADDLEVKGHTRPERLAANEEEIAEMKKKIVALELENAALSKYPTDEDEVAALIVAASDVSKPEAERVAAIAQVLRQRAKINGNTEFI